MNRSEKKTNKELRKFGLVMTVPLAIIGLLMLWRGKPAAPYFLGLAVFFLVTGLAVPMILAPIEKVWMSLAKVLSVIVTHIILTLTFYLVITPMGLLMRLLRKDLLQLKAAPDRSSFWIKVDPDGPCSRVDKPY